MWPGGVRPSYKLTEEEVENGGEEEEEKVRMLRCVLARAKLIGSVPDDLRRLLGTRQTTQGMTRYDERMVLWVCGQFPLCLPPPSDSVTYYRSVLSTAGCACVSLRPRCRASSPPTPSPQHSGHYGNSCTQLDCNSPTHWHINYVTYK